MGSEKYKLKWSKYESNILSAFHGLLESENLSDVTLFCEGQTFKAHRLVLAACSTHFETLFSHTPVNAPLHNQFFVILDGTRADDLQILLHFMYRGEAYLHQDRINSVLRTAEVLQVKGLSEGPRNIEINNQTNLQQQHGSTTTASSRSWSPTLSNEASPRHHHQHKKLDSPLLRRQSSPPPHSGGGNAVSPGYSYPTSGGGGGGVGGSREPFPMYAGSHRGMSSSSFGGGGGSSRGNDPHGGGNGYSPPHSHHNRSKSPPQHRTPYSSNKFMSLSPSSSDNIPKEERNPTPITASTATAADLYEVRSSSRGSDRPPSNKTDSRRTPSDYDPRHCRSPPSSLPSPHHKSNNNNAMLAPAVSSAGFPSDSTTDPIPGPSSGGGILLRPNSAIYATKDENRLRRSSDPGAMEVEPAITPDDDEEQQHPRSKFGSEFRNSREDMAIISSRRSPSSRSTDMRMSEEEVRNQVAATSLETFRRLAQAHQAHQEREREQLLPRGVPHNPRGGGGGVLPVSSLAPGLTASDYMRFAMPVRDPDNGDAISGSGTKLRCPFCERTYGYETNLRAHIRQRHQGIRVSCPYCPRTFTRNNTVRRHVQREHRHLTGRIPTKFGSTRVMPDPLSSVAAAAAAAAAVAIHQGRSLTPPEKQQQQHLP